MAASKKKKGAEASGILAGTAGGGSAAHFSAAKTNRAEASKHALLRNHNDVEAYHLTHRSVAARHAGSKKLAYDERKSASLKGEADLRSSRANFHHGQANAKLDQAAKHVKHGKVMAGVAVGAAVVAGGLTLADKHSKKTSGRITHAR